MNKKKLLIVDDEEDIRELLGSQCSEDYDCIFAVDGEDGWNKFLKYNPDIVLTDIQMPNLTGLQFLEKIRSNHFTTPVIILTAYQNVEYIQKAWRLGAFDFINKPFNFDEILSTLKNASIFGKDTIKAFDLRKKKAS